jgi:hypothetical protein
MIGCFALTGYVLVQLRTDPSLPRILVWFGAAVVAHDLVAFPLYALADRFATWLLIRRARTGHPPGFLPVLNYVRVPVAASLLLLVVFLPGIIEQGTATYQSATGQTQHPFLARWLLITAGLFLVSAASYTLRRSFLHRARQDARSSSVSTQT